MSHVNNERSEFETFPARFEALTGYTPLRWQTRLFERLLNGTIPSTCDLPTGLGKTSVIPIWLIALASPAPNSTVKLPRRLVYIVNRRTVVDQATDVVERMRRRLQNPHDERWINHKNTLHALNSRLWALSAVANKDDSFGVSTLRGEMADNEEWKADPARPTIIVGTIDMVGSKLLFSGYGDGRYHRTHHAGLIGQDVLIVHDEAHLSPAFSWLLWTIEREQREAGERRPITVMELSATARLEGSEDRDKVMRLRPVNSSEEFGLEEEDQEEEIVKHRLKATKRLRLVPTEESGKDALVKSLAALAAEHDEEKCRVLIYVRSPETAQAVRGALSKIIEKSNPDAISRIGVLTGTIRGFERDKLAESDLFEVFKSGSNRPAQLDGRTLYLVSTSAGEVGADLDADHLVCDLSTLDGMIQRLGRVNRLGGKDRVAQVAVIFEKPRAKGAGETDKKPENQKDRLEDAIASTGMILKAMEKEGGDVSPAALSRVLKREDAQTAFSLRPTILPATEVLFDAWSLTSINDNLPGRPEVTAYLHGQTHEPAETYVAWRKEVTLLYEAQVSNEALSDWFRACRIEARERLRDRTERVQRTLADILKTHRTEKADRDFPVVLLDERGNAEWSHLSMIVENARKLRYRTVVLPIEVRGLDSHGMLNNNAVTQIDDNDIDKAEPTTDGVRRERWIDGCVCKRLLTGENADMLPHDLREQLRITLKEAPEDTEDRSEVTELVLMVTPRESALENPETVRFRQTLVDHTNSIVSYMGSIADHLELESSIKNALISAAKWHDQGKNRPIWQRYARNPNAAEPLAKSSNYRHWKELNGYRHEFGSLLEAEACEELDRDPERDLVLHLIAAHHGHARPHFDPRATGINEEAAAEVIRRFGRLQYRFGRWRLAWLESLLRCADIAASKAPAAEPSRKPEISA